MRVLSARLRYVREHQAWGDQRFLADKAGVTSESIIKWRKGQGNPKLSELAGLAEALEVSISHFVSAENTEIPTIPHVARGGSRTSRRTERLERQLQREMQRAREAAERQKKREARKREENS